MILVVTLDEDLTVARELRGLGMEVMVTGLVRDPAPRHEALAAGLRESLFDLSGPSLSISDWTDFVGGFYTLAARASAVVLSGVQPEEMPEDAFAQLIRTTEKPVVVAANVAEAVTGLEELDAHADR